MPTYEYSCPAGHQFERVLPVADYRTPQTCDCGKQGRRIISLPALTFAQPEARYDSPIDGKPITTWKKRRDDLARHGCREYDPGMRQDNDRRLVREQEKLERALDATVEEEIEKMPSAKRERLENELKHGADVGPVSTTLPTSTRVPIDH